MDKTEFHAVLLWLNRRGANFGVDHVSVAGRITWLDSETEVDELFQLYKIDVNVKQRGY